MIINEQELAAIAREAYQVYGKATDFKNYQGLPMPAFDDLTPTIKQAWTAIANLIYVPRIKAKQYELLIDQVAEMCSQA